MENVVLIKRYQAFKDLKEVLPFSSHNLEIFIDTLEEGKSLAKALRAIGLKSPYEISQEVWGELRSWHKKYYVDIEVI